MKFLVSTNVSSFRALEVSWAHVEFCDVASDLSFALTSHETVDVWICNGWEVTDELVGLWLQSSGHVPRAMLVEDRTSMSRLQGYTFDVPVTCVEFPEHTHESISWEETILRCAERLYTRTIADLQFRRVKITREQTCRVRVLLIGAGIVNLITAQFLAVRGFQVRVIEGSPDPRDCHDWTLLGTTHGGGNARMFTRTEADNYNEKGSAIYQDMKSIFRQTVREGGWSVKSPDDLSEAEKAWVHTFEQIPAWLARAFKADIYEVNRQAGTLWEELISASPELFTEVAYSEDVLRLYAEQNALDAAIDLNYELGTVVRTPSREELLEHNPNLHLAYHSEQLAGGVVVQGFTLNIHHFTAKLIDSIKKLGGTFDWNCQVQGLARSVHGEVIGVHTRLGPIEADHYVVSTGVIGHGLLAGTASENHIQGILGVWLQIPNLHPKVQHSMKIHRRGHLVEDINVTLAKENKTNEDILIFGGGYGYVGLDRPDPSSPELRALFAELEAVARIYFPRGHAVAKEQGMLWPDGIYKFCVRPFTPTGLGVFEVLPAASGGCLLITGGNNTGGFAQAPAIARAAWRAIIGERDPIHSLFHPARGSLPSCPSSSSHNMKLGKPPRILLLCSDGPQHAYLRYCLDNAFPGYMCIVETHEGQIRHLKRKCRRVDAWYMQYHSLRRYVTGHDGRRRAYFNQLLPAEYVCTAPHSIVDTLNCSEVWAAVSKWQPDVTIVSGTKYIGRKLMERAGLMINLHMGHLPEYKGNHCIFFALCDGAVGKIAATLHQLTAELDGGDILDTVSPSICEGDSEDTLYTRCLHAAIDRCMYHLQQLSRGQRLEFTPQRTKGQMFGHRDRTIWKELWLWWKMRVQGLLLHKHEGHKTVGGIADSVE